MVKPKSEPGLTAVTALAHLMQAEEAIENYRQTLRSLNPQHVDISQVWVRDDVAIVIAVQAGTSTSDPSATLASLNPTVAKKPEVIKTYDLLHGWACVGGVVEAVEAGWIKPQPVSENKTAG